MDRNTFGAFAFFLFDFGCRLLWIYLGSQTPDFVLPRSAQCGGALILAARACKTGRLRVLEMPLAWVMGTVGAGSFVPPRAALLSRQAAGDPIG
jgi:hypothetical protein